MNSKLSYVSSAPTVMRQKLKRCSTDLPFHHTQISLIAAFWNFIGQYYAALSAKPFKYKCICCARLCGHIVHLLQYFKSHTGPRICQYLQFKYSDASRSHSALSPFSSHIQSPALDLRALSLFLFLSRTICRFLPVQSPPLASSPLVPMRRVFSVHAFWQLVSDTLLQCASMRLLH